MKQRNYVHLYIARTTTTNEKQQQATELQFAMGNEYVMDQ
jgi:hypothetical protein